MIKNLEKLKSSLTLIGRKTCSHEIEKLIKTAESWEEELKRTSPEEYKELTLERDAEKAKDHTEWEVPQEWKPYAGIGNDELRLAFIWHRTTPKGYDKSYRSFLKWYDEQRVINAFRKGQIDPKSLPHLSPGEATTMIMFGDTGR